MRAVLIIKREQQFGIFIYCNVILESFFISFGWFLNENVDGKEKTVMLSMLYADEGFFYMREPLWLFFVCVGVLSGRRNPFLKYVFRGKRGKAEENPPFNMY